MSNAVASNRIPPAADVPSTNTSASESAGRCTGTTTPVDVSLCGYAYTSPSTRSGSRAFDPGSDSLAGGPSQVRLCADALIGLAKERGVTVILVGHVTKDGGLAGPRVLEHVVDTVLAFEGDRHHALRLLRATKHRFASGS